MNDTICAPATSPFNSALAVIRLSGLDALNIISLCFNRSEQLCGRRAVYGNFVNPDNNDIVDDVVAVYYKSPASYTGEDVVEISCHGNPIIVQKIITIMLRNGARFSEPGEFTRRAFLNGKMDLTESEAVNKIINAKSDVEIKSALSMMHGFFKDLINSAKHELITIKADVECGIDFCEEDISFITNADLLRRVNDLRQSFVKLHSRCIAGEKISVGLNIPIVGEPNTGKSSLLNFLINKERAIVSDIPGTTRDTIIETVQMDGVHVNLIDTAGIRSTVNEIEVIGIRKTFEAIDSADIVFYVFDVSRTAIDYSIIDDSRFSVILFNKIDLISDDKFPVYNTNEKQKVVYFSAKTGKGIESLEQAVSDFIKSNIVDHKNVFITDARIINLLNDAVEQCDVIVNSAASNEYSEFIAANINTLIRTLSEITGEVSTDDILDSIFSRFCIGK